MPFSDPLADGPVIQRASERALAGGTTLRGALDDDPRGRGRRSTRRSCCSPTPIPSSAWVRSAFAKAAADAGVDGVLCSISGRRGRSRSAQRLVGAGARSDLSPQPDDHATRGSGRSAELGRGFLYVISRLGVTGARDRWPPTPKRSSTRIRAHRDLPLALGFGISTPEQVAQAGAWADAAVVGSALVT